MSSRARSRASRPTEQMCRTARIGCWPRASPGAGRTPLIVLCAENHRSAAALLQSAVAEALPVDQRWRAVDQARWADTVIGKMSGVIDDPDEIAALGLATITPGLPAAFLVEEFDRILISRVGSAGRAQLHTGMAVLREVDELAPFEDAKLLGHNATHALAGFLAAGGAAAHGGAGRPARCHGLPARGTHR